MLFTTFYIINSNFYPIFTKKKEIPNLHLNTLKKNHFHIRKFINNHNTSFSQANSNLQICFTKFYIINLNFILFSQKKKSDPTSKTLKKKITFRIRKFVSNHNRSFSRNHTLAPSYPFFVKTSGAT